MGTIKELFEIARKQIGTTEYPPNSNNVLYNTWYNGKSVSGVAYPWCMAFVQWCFAQSGVALPLRAASCGELTRAAKSTCWAVCNFQPGDVVIYDFSWKQKTTSTAALWRRFCRTTAYKLLRATPVLSEVRTTVVWSAARAGQTSTL